MKIIWNLNFNTHKDLLERISLCIAYDDLHTIIAELSSCECCHMACKALNIYSLDLHRKKLLTTGVKWTSSVWFVVFWAFSRLYTTGLLDHKSFWCPYVTLNSFQYPFVTLGRNKNELFSIFQHHSSIRQGRGCNFQQ